MEKLNEKLRNTYILLKERYLYFFGCLYLLIPVIIFLVGNVKLFISIPLSVLLIGVLFKTLKNFPKIETKLWDNKYRTIIIAFIIFAWVMFSGVGGFIWQNVFDHKFRNAFFVDLVNRPWPVIIGNKALVYYSGFWMPAVLVGKIFGLTAGYAFQVFWAFLGIFIAFFMICEYLKKVKVRNLLILIFYSGLDILMVYINNRLLLKPEYAMEISEIFKNATHIELTFFVFNSSSNTTLLFWLYNQIVPFWVGMMLLLKCQSTKSIGFIYALMLLFSPFPLVPLTFVVLYFIFRKNEEIVEKNLIKNAFKKIKYAISFDNIVSSILLAIIVIYFKSNISVNKLQLLELKQNTFLEFAIYFIFEYVVYLVFIIKKNYKDPILYILGALTIFMPFITLGNSYDFAWRTCIPFAFYIMLLVMKEFNSDNTHKFVKVILFLVLAVGAVTPFLEFERTYMHEKDVLRDRDIARSTELNTSFNELSECYTNFIGMTDSIFYKYLAK